ncbi:hypothetical protein O5282_00140 [Escherichia coli]|nr:hypothetical protein [Escherichia coli]
MNYSVTELSEKSHASEATIVRTCKKLGYQGYYHLKIALAKKSLILTIAILIIPTLPI